MQNCIRDIYSTLQHNSFCLRLYQECMSMMISIILKHNHNVAIVFFLIY